VEQRQVAEAARLLEKQRQVAEAAQLAEQQQRAAEVERLAEEQRQQVLKKARDAEQQSSVEIPPIEALLSAAESDLAALRLTNPQGDNAVDKYRRVLALDADNALAQAGLMTVVERYIALATETSTGGRFDKAMA
jgi:hypothetical protein